MNEMKRNILRLKRSAFIGSLISICILASSCNSFTTETNNIAMIDSDGDGWSDVQESQVGTNPELTV